uniref:Protein kinase domain-containing protein n=1 Tax=Rhabditophanes sp. KR3021 TaxID=114890 RepID=A0AC35U826_9BILA
MDAEEKIYINANEAEKLCVCAGEPITNSKFCEYCGYILDYRNVTLKIGDFGLTTTDDEVNLINIGTTGYCAPEASNGMFTTKSDVFSFSMIMWEFITHKKAFAKLNSNNITYEIGKCEDRLPLLEIPDCHDILLSIINNGLDWSPYKRMNFGEIIGRFSQYLKEDNSSSNTVEQFKALDIRQCPFLTKILDQQLSVNQVLKLSVDNKSYNLILKEDIHSIKDKASNCKYKLSKSNIPDESNLKHGHNILVQNEEYIPREMKNNESTIKIEEYSKREENAFKTDESTIKTDDSRVTDVEDDNVGEGKETNDFHSPIHADIVNSERKNKSNLFKSVINIFSKSKKKHSVKTESDSEKSEMKNSYSEKLENSKSAEEQSSLNETMISTDNKGNSLTNFIDLDSKPSKLKYYLKKLILKERVALPKIAEEEKAETLIKQLRKKKEKFFSRFSTEPFDEEFFDVEKYITCLNNNTLTDNTNPNNTTIDNNDKDHDYESSEISLVDLKDACRLGNVKRRKKKIKNNPRKFSRNVKMSTRVPNRISDSDGEYIGCKLDTLYIQLKLK